MATSTQLLEAGALLAPTTKLKDNDGIDTVSARSYSHPALAQPVVRLTADNLANGDDLMMEFLGFGEPKVTGPVAKQRRQALGFPGWALVNDPDHARYALELVKEFRKEIRRANSKPGHAWEGLTEIAKRLGQSVAHFLPSFWEQTGREFIAVGNATYASRAFSKAREAEGVHGLKVDENLRQDSFLEFALAGCVSAKALTQYGKDLLAAHEPVEAWEFMKNLTVRRTLGGLPPWTNVCKDLAPLIKAAGKDPKEELPVLVELMLDSPAMNRAAMGFWKSASPYIKVLAAKEPRVAGTLLNLIPKSTSWSDPEIWQWLEHLKSWDILENAWATDIPEEAGPKDGPAAWFHRLLEANSKCPQLAFDILEQMADRLIQDGTELNLYTKYRWGNNENVDLDLLDLALSLKIPVADPSEHLEISLSHWASNPANDPTSKDRPRDPLFVKKDNRFTQKLIDAVDSVAGDNDFEDAAQGKTALKEARKSWLMKTLDELCGGGMPDFDDKQASFVRKTRPATFQEFPDAAAKLKKLDPLPSLINTLKTFVPAEYGWPKLEEVVDQFEGDHKLLDDLNQPKSKLLICGSFPDAIVSDGIKAVVVRGNEVIHEAELKLPKNKTLMGLQFLDGDLKVIVKQDYQSLQFWNSKPKVSDTAYGSDKANLTAPVLHLEGGGTFTGNHVIHAGDAQHLTSTEPGSFFHDGTTIWNLDWDDSYNERETREFDIATGKKGRKSLPAFFEDFAKQEMKLQPGEMQLLSYPGLVDESPLGSKEGLIGFRIRSNEKGKYECESIDGRSFTTTSNKLKPTSLLQQPGTKAFLPVVFDRSYRGFECEVYSANGELRSVQYSNNSDTYIQGHTTAYPQAFWHVLKVRDIETSKLLRKITRKQVQTLVDAAAKDADGRKKPKAGEPFLVKNLNAAIKKTFPKLKDPRLQEGIRSIVLRFERRSRELLKQIENRDPAKARKTNVPSVDDQKIIQTVKNVGEHIYSYRATNLAEGIADTAAFLSGELESTRTSMATVTAISALLSNLPAKVWLLSWMQEDETDDAWRKTFDLISQTTLCDLKGSFRIVEVEVKNKLPFPVPDSSDDDEDENDGETTFTWTKGSSRFLISKDWRTYTVLEYSKTGKFAKLAGIDPESAEEFSNLWTSKQLKEFLTESAKHLHQYPAVDFAKERAKEMNLSVAELSLIWFGFPKLDAYEANFMPKHLRTAMKLKTKEASAAKESLKMIEPATRMDLLNQALDGSISDLWQDPPTAFADRLKAVFQSSQPDVSFIPTEHSETFGKLLGYRSHRAELMKALSSPKDHPWFSPRSKWKLELNDGGLTLACQPSDAEFDSDLLQHSALCIAWLSYVLPVGHASLAKIGPLQDALLKALANPNLLLDAGSSWLWELDDDKAREKLITAAIGKPKKQKGMLIADDGTLIAGLASNTLERAFRPAKLKKPADYQKVQNQLDASATKEYVRRCDATWLVELVRDTHFTAIVERLQTTKVAEGQFEANPVQSCPALVKKIAKAKNLSEEAAAYYLQLLCLPDPTDRNVKLWNDWTPAQLKKASAELLKSELVLEAKRARAGRKLFLPGGWEALKAPHLPLETWKLPLFKMYRDSYDRATPLLPLIVPLQPVHELFAAGWKRITSGDEPKYEEV